MADEGRTAIWTPHGMAVLGGKPLDRVELTPRLMEWFYQFALFAEHFKLGLHCSQCQKDVVGKNSDTARTFSVACGCREFIGLNRDVQRAPDPGPMMNSFLGNRS
jgi:hypothetical protein